MEKFLNEFQEQVQHDGAESAMSDLKAMAAVALLPFQDAKVLIGEIMIVKAVTEYEESLKKGNQGTADAAASVLSKLDAEVASGVLQISRDMFHPVLWGKARSILEEKEQQAPGDQHEG